MNVVAGDGANNSLMCILRAGFWERKPRRVERSKPSRDSKVNGEVVMKREALCLISLTYLTLSSSWAKAEVPHVFQPGQIISAEQMNENFALLAQGGGET